MGVTQKPEKVVSFQNRKKQNNKGNMPNKKRKRKVIILDHYKTKRSKSKKQMMIAVHIKHSVEFFNGCEAPIWSAQSCCRGVRVQPSLGFFFLKYACKWCKSRPL